MTSKTKISAQVVRSRFFSRLLRAGSALIIAGLIFVVVLGVGFTIASRALGPPPLGASDHTSVVVLDRNGRLLRPFATQEGRWRLPVTTSEVDPHYIQMLLAYEDRRFHSHFGVDPLALGRAFWQLLRYGEIVSGGSTLTMQLARLTGERDGRTLKSKLIQIVRAIQIERQLSKDEILRRYLTLAPFGGNIEGVRAASLAYFGKEPRRLSNSEIALLVSLPQSPETRRPDRFPDIARNARDRVLDRAVGAGLITASEAIYAKKNPVPAARKPFPMYAAHITETHVQERSELKVHRLTIEGNLQKGLERLARTSANQLGPRLSAAILVADKLSGDVLAHVGSPGYLDEGRFGAIDMVRALRSPGSALKPFIYGLAFDAGLCHPSTLIEDRPARFGDYRPENFDQTYRGTVTIREALQLSLNVPAVKVLASLGPARLASKLQRADLDLKIPRNLAVALGGVGIRLSGLTKLYVALARGGDVIPLNYKYIDKGTTDARGLGAEEAKRILSPEAAWHIADILKGSPPPKNARGGTIAYKTGTSYGHRDAWAVGFDGRYVIAVWVGRPDGTATPGLTGLTSAAPLLFDAFSRVTRVRTPIGPAPKSALQATTADLPRPLAYFRDLNQENILSSGSKIPLRISFPPNKAEVEIVRQDGLKPMPILLKAEGGRLPLTWLADGAPISSGSRRRKTFYAPPSRGFVKFTVIDANGQVDRVNVRIR